MGAIGAFINVGKIDGSNAWAGTEGEFVYASNRDTGPWPTFSSNAYFQVGTLALSAGDWMVGGYLDQWLATDLPAGVAIYAWGWNYLGPADDPNWANTDGGWDRAWAFSNGGSAADAFGTHYPITQNEQGLAPFRFNTTSPRSVMMQVMVETMGGVVNVQCNWTIWARRMR